MQAFSSAQEQKRASVDDAAASAPQQAAQASVSQSAQRHAAGEHPYAGGGEQQAAERGVAGPGEPVAGRRGMEDALGADLGDVRVHTGRRAQDACEEMGADAYALGDQVAFADAEPAPGVMAHELAHVIQQGAAPPKALAGDAGAVQAGDTQEQEESSAAAPDQEQEAQGVERAVQAKGPVAPIRAKAPRSVQRRTADVSRGRDRRGRRREEQEDTERVDKQGNQFEDMPDAFENLRTWKKTNKLKVSDNGAIVEKSPPTSADLLYVFYQMTPAQRSKVWLDVDGVLKALFKQLDPRESMRVMQHCDFPLNWKIIHWYADVRDAAGASHELMRTIISNSPLGQRIHAAKDPQAVGLLEKDLPNDHPLNLFGDDLREACYPSEDQKVAWDAANPVWARWSETAEYLDAEARWAFVAQAPALNIPLLEGQPAAHGLNKWTSLLRWGPRGSALTEGMGAHIDTSALTQAVGATHRNKMFLMRFNTELEDVANIDYKMFETVWKNLNKLPDGIVTSDLVTKIVASAGNTALGVYTDVPSAPTFGEITYDEVADVPGADWADLGHTVRHEIGHQADTKLGGFSNFCSRAPAFWKKWQTRKPWLESIIEYMDNAMAGKERDGLLDMLGAHLDGAAFANPFAGENPVEAPLIERKRLWKSVADHFAANRLDQALDTLRAKGKQLARGAHIKTMLDDAKAEEYPRAQPNFVNDRYFLAHYSEFYSYHRAGDEARERKAGRSAYTLANSYDFYADLFAAYFSTWKQRANNVPSWAAPYFLEVQEQYGRKAMKDKGNNRSMGVNDESPRTE